MANGGEGIVVIGVGLGGLGGGGRGRLSFHGEKVLSVWAGNDGEEVGEGGRGFPPRSVRPRRSGEKHGYWVIERYWLGVFSSYMFHCAKLVIASNNFVWK